MPFSIPLFVTERNENGFTPDSVMQNRFQHSGFHGIRVRNESERLFMSTLSILVLANGLNGGMTGDLDFDWTLLRHGVPFGTNKLASTS
jgi:hypothetical protein